MSNGGISRPIFKIGYLVFFCADRRCDLPGLWIAWENRNGIQWKKHLLAVEALDGGEDADE